MDQEDDLIDLCSSSSAASSSLADDHNDSEVAYVNHRRLPPVSVDLMSSSSSAAPSPTPWPSLAAEATAVAQDAGPTSSTVAYAVSSLCASSPLQATSTTRTVPADAQPLVDEDDDLPPAPLAARVDTPAVDWIAPLPGPLGTFVLARSPMSSAHANVCARARGGGTSLPCP
jgi:hypothetical protein